MNMTLRLTLIGLVLALLVPWTASAQNQSDFTPSGSIWGFIFGDFYYKASGEDAGWGRGQYARRDKGMNAGELRRLYFGYDYRFHPKLSSRILFEANDGSTFANGSYGLFIKVGQVSWSEDIAGRPFTVNLGLVPTPVFSFPERGWGYRAVERSILDKRGVGRSVDQGVSVAGAFDREGRFGYSFLVGNNSGTRPATDPQKATYGSVHGSFLDGKLDVELMGSLLPTDREASTSIGRVTLLYRPARGVFGVETALASVAAPRELPSSSEEHLDRLLFSAFSAIPIVEGDITARLFLRWDYYDPDLDFDVAKGYIAPDAFYQEHLFIAGVQIQPVTGLYVMPNLWLNRYAERSGTESRAMDVVPRITFHFTF